MKSILLSGKNTEGVEAWSFVQAKVLETKIFTLHGEII
jgi:hypothetical protein